MFIRRSIIAFFLNCLLVTAALAQNTSTAQRWNLKDVDIKTVVEEVSRATGKNFLLDPAVSGRITLISSTDLTSAEAYEAFLSALEILGYAAVPAGDVIKIVPDAKARNLASTVVDGAAQGDSLVTRVIPLKFVSAAQMVSSLRNLVSTQGHLSAYAPSNSLIVADRASTVDKIARLAAKLDVEDAQGMDVVRLKHASASDVVAAVGEMLQSRRGPEITPLMLSADDRTNSVLVSGDKERRISVTRLIQELDIATPEGGNSEVIYLKFQKAEDLVPVLGNILDSYAAQNQARSPGGNRNLNTARAPTQPTVFSSQENTVVTDSSNNDVMTTERQASGLVVGPYGVQAEPNMNALIVTAPPSLMRNLKSVIARLDVRRAQVLVEAIIVEVRGNLSDEFGVEWRGAGDLAGGTSFPTATNDGLLNTYQATLDAGGSTLPGAGLAVGFIRGGSLRFMLHALESENNVNVLSTPSLVAMDNVAAQIKVGEQIPFPIGEYATTGGVNTVTPFITTEYRDVGLQLQFVPQITSGNAIQMQITQKVDDLGPQMQDKPTTSTREISTKVLVDDGDILVLGGLIGTTDRIEIAKVPFLGDIPLFGKLFESERLSTEKTNLMVFLRPVILRDRQKGLSVTQTKYDQIRSLQILNQPIEDSQYFDAKILPPWQSSDVELPQPFLMVEQ